MPGHVSTNDQLPGTGDFIALTQPRCNESRRINDNNLPVPVWQCGRGQQIKTTGLAPAYRDLQLILSPGKAHDRYKMRDITYTP